MRSADGTTQVTMYTSDKQEERGVRISSCISGAMPASQAELRLRVDDPRRPPLAVADALERFGNRLRGGLLEVGDEVVALSLLLEAGEDHLGALQMESWEQHCVRKRSEARECSAEEARVPAPTPQPGPRPRRGRTDK
jgi:hypothetical protein